MYDLNVSGATQHPRRSSDHTMEYKAEFIPSTTNNTNNNSTTIPMRRRRTSSTTNKYSVYDRQPSVNRNNSRSGEEEKEAEDALKQRTRRPSDSTAFNAINNKKNNNSNRNNYVRNTVKHMRRPNTQQQQQEEKEEKEQSTHGQESPDNLKEMPVGLHGIIKGGVSGPHTPRLSLSSPVVVHMEALTGPAGHDIITQTRLNFHNPPKLTLQPQTPQPLQHPPQPLQHPPQPLQHPSQPLQHPPQSLQHPSQPLQPRPYLTPPTKCSYACNKCYDSAPAPAVFSMSPGGATSLSASLRHGSVGSFNSSPHTPQSAWANLREKTGRNACKVDNEARQTLVSSLPREEHADCSNADVSPISAFPTSLVKYRSPLANRQPTGSETPSTELAFQQQQQQPLPPKEKKELAELLPFLLTKKPLSSKKDEAAGNGRTQQQQQQQQQTLLQVPISSTNKSNISGTRYSGMNNTSSYCNGRPANLSTSMGFSLPAISFPNGACVPLQATRNGKNSGLNHIDKSPRTTGRMRMESGCSECNSGIQIPCSSQGIMESARSMQRQQQQQERKNRSVQELLFQEIVTQLRTK
ncbi:hypothetical protein LSM04_002616 [Trypanosoma melophagium]|uniref:uncharacterized protein n=1 Tax=Trypanosoma melophagium TaxID=715481 RepID=UPI00351A67D6|nr:hypothetical protein LSM04_002616 [Trypanosoma melophagium]